MRMDIFYNLRKYEKYLTTAHDADYIRALNMKEVKELTEIGAELGIAYKHNNCPKCLLKFVKQLADKYFEQKNSKSKKGNNGNKERKEGQESSENGSADI